MIIEQEWIDVVCREHGRTSCDDERLSNYFGGELESYNPKTGKKDVTCPRCNRCYLMSNIGHDINNLEFKVNIDIYLEFKGNK